MYNQIENVEQQVCDFFALPIEEVFSKSTRRDLTLARHFVIYILHKHYKVSLSKLANRYKCSKRNIEITCANIGFFVEYDKKYQNYYKKR